MRNFKDYPDFKPNVAPKDVFKKGTLEGHFLDLFFHLLQVKIILVEVQYLNIQNHGLPE